MRRYTPNEVFTYAKHMSEANVEMNVGRSWLSALLTNIATNNPKEFPKSPAAFLEEMKPKKAMEPSQWEAMIKMLCAPSSGDIVIEHTKSEV